MTQTDQPTPDRPPLSTAARLGWLLVILATLYICYFHNLGAIGFVGPDEPRYAWIARDMAESGDWVTPRLYGKPWFEKPVLYYWGAALSFKLFGVSEAAARFPSALAALLATLAMAWLAWRVYGPEAARWLLLLLPTTVGMIGFSHAAATDMPFAGMLTIAMVFAARLLGLVPTSASSSSVARSASFEALFMGVFLGLAVLAKGPAAIILSGGAVLLWAKLTKRWRDAFRCFHPVAILSFCAAALPWYVLCARRNSDFFRVFIIEHNFKRYLTPEFQHIQPFWFYVPVLLIALFPWTVGLVPTTQKFAAGVKQRLLPEFAFELFMLSLVVFALVFFSISKSKLPGYILPAIPPLGLLLTESMVAAHRGNRRIYWLAIALGASLIILGTVFLLSGRRLPADTDIYPAPYFTEVALVGWLAGLMVLSLGVFRRSRIALPLMVLFLLVLVVQTDNLLTHLDRGLTARRTLTEATRIWPDFDLRKATTWQLNRSLLYQLDFYAHSPLLEWKIGDPKPKWLLVDLKHMQEARKLGFACTDYLIYPAVIPCKAMPSVASLGGPGAP